MVTPFFSIIIPLREKTFYLFPFTLDSLIPQMKEASFEVILVDGTEGKAVLTHLPMEDVKVMKAEKGSLSAILNQALKAARGHYVHILNPGEFYIFNHALVFIMKMLQGYDFPDLLYSPRRVRGQMGQPTIDLKPLSKESLKRGEMSNSLQAYWMRREVLLMMGGFRENYDVQCGYDLICRMFLTPTVRKIFMKRVLTDYEYRNVSPEWLWKYSIETAKISLKYFGPSASLLWWGVQNSLRLFRFSWKIITASFWKKHETH